MSRLDMLDFCHCAEIRVRDGIYRDCSMCAICRMGTRPTWEETMSEGEEEL